MRKFQHLAWDEENIYHIARHEVSVEEVEQVAFSSRTCIRKGKGEGTYYLFGQTESGRYLFIVLRDFHQGIGKAITSRDMSDKERRWFREWRGK